MNESPKKLTDYTRGVPNYAAIALGARERLRNDEYCGIENVTHPDPTTNQPCTGVLVISYLSWEYALKQQAMRETGSISATCVKCGGGGFINKDQQIIEI